MQTVNEIHWKREESCRAVSHLDSAILLNDIVRKILLVFVDNFVAICFRDFAMNQDDTAQ